jgi:hypothetical protein
MSDEKQVSEESLKDKMILTLGDALSEPLPPDDSWNVSSDPGILYMPAYPEGSFDASLSELSEAFRCRPDCMGSSASGNIPFGQLQLAFYMIDPDGREWTIATFVPSKNIDDIFSRKKSAIQTDNRKWTVCLFDRSAGLSPLADMLSARLKRQVTVT